MEHLKVIILALASIALFGDATIRAQGTKPAQLTALDLLRSREPKVAWINQSLLKADFDYDGVDDYALGGHREQQYVVGVVKGPIVAQSKHWTLAFSANASDQGALCSVSTAKIEVEPLDDDNVEGASKLPRTSRGINLSDGACDSFHIYWDRKSKRFVWWRL